MPRQRPITGFERLWLAADRICAPFVNQLVIEGQGTPSGLEAAVQAAAQAHPGLSLRLGGKLRATAWEAGGLPPSVQEVDGRSWDGHGPAPFLDQPIDPTRGPVTQVLWVRPRWVVVRTHHAVTDGAGARGFALDLFRALRGEPLVGAGWTIPAQLTEALAALPTTADGDESGPWAAPLGPACSKQLTVSWARQTAAAGVKRPLFRVLSALVSQPSRVAVPVDLRPLIGADPSSANLTGIVHLRVQPGQPVEALREALDGALRRGEHLQSVAEADALRGLPLWLMAWIGRRAARASLVSGRWDASATVSNLGWQEPAAFSGGGFRALRTFWVPPGNPGNPMFITLTGGPLGLEICASAPTALADGARLRGALHRLADDLG